MVLHAYTEKIESFWRNTAAVLRHETDQARHGAEIAQYLPPTIQGSAIDYGCGGGAGLDALVAAGCSDVLGVDVTSTAGGGKGYRVIHPDALPDLPDRSFDFVLCTSVLQHLYDEGHARAVLSELARLAKPGAGFLIQARYFEPGDQFDPAKLPADYERRAIRSHAWEIGAFFAALDGVGLRYDRATLERQRKYAWVEGVKT